MKGILALITARGGSKGIPKKNKRLLLGRPLIWWSIEAAKNSPSVGRIITSTDDNQIAEIARESGSEVPFRRPNDLSGDDSPHILVVLHALEWLERHERYQPEYVLLLQPTSPLRTSEDIEAAAGIAEDRGADAVVAVEETHHHPYLVKRVARDGTLADYVASDIAYPRRQNLPGAYFINGAIYLIRRPSLVRERTFLPAFTYPYVMPRERSLQVDTMWDWFLVEKALEARDGR